MNWFVHPEPSKRVLLAGTYNAHPVPTMAAIATMERLLMNEGEVYRWVEHLGSLMHQGLEQMIGRMGIRAVVCRQGSAFCLYFMDHSPTDWHDLAAHHDFELDQNTRRQLIERGVYVFPLATKQWSISFAHSQPDIEMTLEQIESSLRQLFGAANLRDDKTISSGEFTLK